MLGQSGLGMRDTAGSGGYSNLGAQGIALWRVGQELSPDSDCLRRIQQNPQLPTRDAHHAHHLLTLPSRASSTETSRKKK